MGGLGRGTAQLDNQVGMRPRYTIYNNRLCGCRQLGVVGIKLEGYLMYLDGSGRV